MEEDWALTKAAMAATDGAEGRVAAEGGAEAGRGQRLRRSPQSACRASNQKRPAANASARKCTLSQNGYGAFKGIAIAKGV